MLTLSMSQAAAASPPDAVTPAAGTVAASDGRTLTVWHWPRKPDRPPVHWAHANGFHGRVYTPMLEQLAAFANVSAWDMRGHGASAAAADPETFRGWETYYRDLTALVDAADEPLWLAGHSIGATSSIMAAVRRPEKVRGLLLAEPVIMDRRQGLALAASKLMRRSHRSPLSAGAARRRKRFESRAAALANYKGRGAFKTWPDDYLAAYVEHGFVDDDEGVHLACPRAWESLTFAATEHDPCPGVRRLGDLGCPVIVLGGEQTNTFSERARRRFRRLAPQSEVDSIAGTTHFLPMERADVIIEAALRLINGQAATR